MAKITDEQVSEAWQRAMSPERQEPIRRLYEDAALDVVKAIRRDYMPDMDSNDGGQMLSWLLDLVCVAVITEVDRLKLAALELTFADVPASARKEPKP